jgi:carboxyl-terminal processing protease
MTIKRVFIPTFLVTTLFAILGLTGLDPIFLNNEDHKINLRKYYETQFKIVNNYVNPVDIQKLYKSSLIGFVKSLQDSTLTLANSPIDTVLAEGQITSIQEAYRSFENAYLYTLETAPDENFTKATENALRAMFSNLDPHSVYIEPKDNEKIQEEFAGKFQGIGVSFNILDDTITVVNAITGGPSAQLGIRSGDRIVTIDGESSVGFTDNEDVVKRLRGDKGTVVNVDIVRPGEDNKLNFSITRDDIPIVTVDTHYMLDQETGYIKVNRFAATTYQEFMAAVVNLQKEGMTKLVFDLRNNPGGYMNQAIGMSEEFFGAGTSIVATSSRHKRFSEGYSSNRDGQLKDLPLIVLIDEGSASASEIVSGAIQDHDRGLIVGKRSFGKGLVQQQYPLADNSNIRVTISKYLTPSGRLIQKPYENGREAYAYEIFERKQTDAETDATEFLDNVPDSLKYNTDAGRVVYGGGGIIPDHIITNDTTRNFSVLNYGTRKRIVFDFVRAYLDIHGDEFRAKYEQDFTLFNSSFEWPEEELTTIYNKYLENGLAVRDTVKTPTFERFNDSTFVQEADTSFWKMQTLDSLYLPTNYYKENEWMISNYAKAEVARQIWDFSYYWQVYNAVFDDVLVKAQTLWPEVQELKEYATKMGKTTTKEKKDSGK